MARKVPRAKLRQIATERMKTLFEEAGKAFKKHPERSDRYVELAVKISTKNKVPIPRELKRRFCKKCKSYLVPSINLRVRTKPGYVIYTCQVCKHISRYRNIRKKGKEKKA